MDECNSKIVLSEAYSERLSDDEIAEMMAEAAMVDLLFQSGPNFDVVPLPAWRQLLIRRPNGSRSPKPLRPNSHFGRGSTSTNERMRFRPLIFFLSSSLNARCPASCHGAIFISRGRIPGHIPAATVPLRH